MTGNRFVARYTRQATGWVVTARRSGRAHRAGAAVTTAAGRTLETARAAIAAALADTTGTYRGNVVIDDEVDLAPAALRKLTVARDARRIALEAAAAHQAASAAAARALLDDGLSLRDTAYLLGISHTRVLQLTDSQEEKHGQPQPAHR